MGVIHHPTNFRELHYMKVTHNKATAPFHRYDVKGRPRPESIIAMELASWRTMKAPVHPRDFENPYLTAMDAIVRKVAKWLGYDFWQGLLTPVPTELGGGWLVSAIAPCRGPDGYFAHIDEFGWVLRVEPYPGLRWPDHKTPIAEIMSRLVDDPCWPGLGLIQYDEEGRGDADE